MAEGVLGGAHVAKSAKRRSIAILVHFIVGHTHVTLTNCLTLDVTKVNGFLLWIILDDFNDREPVNRNKASIGTDRRRGIVQIHARTRFL